MRVIWICLASTAARPECWDTLPAKVEIRAWQPFAAADGGGDPGLEWGSGGFEKAGLTQEPRLVSTLREALTEWKPDRIGIQAHPNELGERILSDGSALTWAALIAARSLPGNPEVTLVDEQGKTLWEGQAADGWTECRALWNPPSERPSATAVVSTWNKADDVCANIEALLAQVEAFDEIVLVDNASSDGTVTRVRAEFPEVRVVVMPHSQYGACETFNIGFACAQTDLTAILDDDVVLPAAWLRLAKSRMLREPETTAVVSTKIVEPGMPESYKNSEAINTERYMSTFRGCASLARTQALSEAKYYDERLFIYGNERDLTCRLLNLGYRVLQYPEAVAHHKTPFGIKMGKRSLFYHARNAWISMLKYAPMKDLVRMPFQVVRKVLFRSKEVEAQGDVSDATGTIGIGRSIKETKGSVWVITKAAFSVLYNVPYCIKHRQPVRSEDFELPLD